MPAIYNLERVAEERSSIVAQEYAGAEVRAAAAVGSHKYTQNTYVRGPRTPGGLIGHRTRAASSATRSPGQNC
jgi:hypothetical protein